MDREVGEHAAHLRLADPREVGKRPAAEARLVARHEEQVARRQIVRRPLHEHHRADGHNHEVARAVAPDQRSEPNSRKRRLHDFHRDFNDQAGKEFLRIDSARTISKPGKRSASAGACQDVRDWMMASSRPSSSVSWNTNRVSLATPETSTASTSRV